MDEKILTIAKRVIAALRGDTSTTEHDGDVIYKLGNAEIADGKITMQPQSFLMICE